VDLLIDFLSSYNSSRACSRPKQQNTGSWLQRLILVLHTS